MLYKREFVEIEKVSKKDFDLLVNLIQKDKDPHVRREAAMALVP